MAVTKGGEISSDQENTARSMLIEHYQKSYGDHVMEQVDLLLALDGYIGRFNYLQSVLGEGMRLLPGILISGYSAGSEMIVARQFGFQEIYGVEVDSALLEATKIRLAGLTGMFPALYDGLHLPYHDEQFDIVVSGHIIEHTQSPSVYLRESMRVLKDGGILYIEFPTRYHFVELHTGLFSFEWLPTFLRNFLLRLLSSRFSFLDPQKRSRYKSILTTGLKQVSRRGILRLLRKMNIHQREIAHSRPAPGIIRCIIQKVS